MKGKLTTIKATGKIEATDYIAPPGLDALQKAVGGYIEIVPGLITYEGADCVAFCNEEGKLNGLPFNEKATAAWQEAYGGPLGDVLLGDVAIVTGDNEFLEGV
jgi:hypothetical protein